MYKTLSVFFIVLLFSQSLKLHALTISNTIPNANALNVSINPDISVVFSAAVDDSPVIDQAQFVELGLFTLLV